MKNKMTYLQCTAYLSTAEIFARVRIGSRISLNLPQDFARNPLGISVKRQAKQRRRGFATFKA